MFGRGDAFLIPIARMLRRLPVFPLFGRGQTQLQPAYVEDVADAIARVMRNTKSLVCYDLGGPRVYTYRSLLEVIALHLAACRTEYYSGYGGGRLTRTHAPLARFRLWTGSDWACERLCGAPCHGARPGTAAPRQAGARTNIRFKFQAMVTRLHSPRTFSSPRSKN